MPAALMADTVMDDAQPRSPTAERSRSRDRLARMETDGMSALIPGLAAVIAAINGGPLRTSIDSVKAEAGEVHAKLTRMDAEIQQRMSTTREHDRAIKELQAPLESLRRGQALQRGSSSTASTASGGGGAQGPNRASDTPVSLRCGLIMGN